MHTHKSWLKQAPLLIHTSLIQDPLDVITYHSFDTLYPLTMSTSNVIIAHLNNVVQKESEYKKGISKNHVNAKTSASTLRADGPLEQLLNDLVKEGIFPEEQIETFFKEQRDRLKEVAKHNVENAHQVDQFVHAANTLRAQESAGTATSDDDDEKVKDYELIFKTTMQDDGIQQQSVPLLQDKLYRDICEALGEELDQDDEDGVAVVMNGTSQEHSLKCPITGTLARDPLKNKVCHHVYSKEGITSYLQQQRGPRVRCPVAGCSNANLAWAQLEEDLETATHVRRVEKKHERQLQQRASQAATVDTDDEEFDMN
jgi:hypothetical protein